MSPDVFVMPGDASRIRIEDFLARHPTGYCDRLEMPPAVQWQDRKPTRSRAYGICSCGDQPCFVKVIAWDNAMESRWNELPATIERHQDLHGNALFLSPFAHLRSPEDWIRIYPVWPTDLSYFLQTPTGQTLPAHAALSILQRAATALSLMDHQQILHRDLKASNILVRDARTGHDPDILSVDFLEITLADFSDETTCGTEHWSAPEMALNRPTALSPIFSLGLLAWKLLARSSFRRMLRNFPLYNAKIGWPGEAEMFLWCPVSPFAETVARTDVRIWRDPEALVLRNELLQFVFAATAYEVNDRAWSLQNLFGAPCGNHPADQVRDWFASLSRDHDSCVEPKNRPERMDRNRADNSISSISSHCSMTGAA